MKNNEPVTILVDTRELETHPWEKHISSPIIRGTMKTGDFSIPGCDDWIAIERKTLGDFIQSISWHRDRFERELQRSARIDRFCVVIEGRYSELITGAYRSNMTPQSAWGSMMALQERYRCPFYFLENEKLAARFAEEMLQRWYQEHEKALDRVRRAIKKAKRSQKNV